MANSPFVLNRLLGGVVVRRLARLLPQGIRSTLAGVLAGRLAATEEAVEGLRRHARQRLDARAAAHDADWQAVRTLDGFERWRATRMEALRASIGESPESGEPVVVRVTNRIDGAGYRIENLVYRSRPHLWVTAQLYRPAAARGRMPAIVVCHSHHTGKSHAELRSLGALWSAAGCAVLVPDLLGHGERRQHPFGSARDYRLPFKLDRQDYYFRYNLGLQLQLAGESLIGWMVWDLRRGIDLLEGLPEVDRDRIVLIGSVAGGGDVAAVAAALDRRVAGLVGFGLRRGGVTAGDRASARTVPGTGEGSWESTRCLRGSARDGFLPWVVLAGCAPRHLVYAHEFDWDAERDPGWRRLQRVYRLYGAEDRLAAIQGRGSVRGSPPHNTHCTHVGALHRRLLDPILHRWFDIPLPAERAVVVPVEEELACLPDGGLAELGSRPVHRLLTERVRQSGATIGPAGWVEGLPRLLGDCAPAEAPRVVLGRDARILRQRAETVRLEVDPGVACALRLILPGRASRVPLAIGLAQAGIRRLAHGRSGLVRGLLRAGIAVCLVEPRGSGPRLAPARHDPLAGVAASEMMLGGTLLGARLRDLRTAMAYLRTRPELDADRIALWGDSLARTNSRDFDPAVPYDAGPFPELSEPLGGLLALYGALLEPDVRAVYARGGLLAWRSLLESPFWYAPFDVVAPGILSLGELADAAAALAPRPLWLDALVDGLNRRATLEELQRAYGPALAAYGGEARAGRLRLGAAASSQPEVARWLAERLGS